MGYPMTWRRVVSRNGLADGDYGQTPSAYAYGDVLLDGVMGTMMTERETILARAPGWAEQIKKTNGRLACLAGDLRRMERDVTDEQYVCKEIARRTGIDPDIVAAVIQEFMNV